MSEVYQKDIQTILSKRYDNGADYWTTPDKRLIKGSPFTTLDCAYLLTELGMNRSEPGFTGNSRFNFQHLAGRRQV